MDDLSTRLHKLKRPDLLVQAARSGLSSYRRDTHLAPAMGERGHARLVRCKDALHSLLEIEQDLNVERRARSTGYCYARHVEVLIALMAEAQLLRLGVGVPIAAE